MDSEILLPTSQGSALESAIHELRSLYPAGSGTGTIDWKDQSGREQRRLADWATDTGLLFSVNFSGPNSFTGKAFAQGEEHQVFPVETENRVLKLTRHGTFGRWVGLKGGMVKERPATPLEYLTRLHLSNVTWKDDIHLVRIVRDAPRLFIASTQPWLIGGPPSLEEIAALMSAHGFEVIKETNSRGWFRREDRLSFVMPTRQILSKNRMETVTQSTCR